MISFSRKYTTNIYSKLFKLIPYPINIFFKNYLINVVNEIEFGLIAIKKNQDPVNYPKPKELKNLYEEIKNKKIRYEK